MENFLNSLITQSVSHRWPSYVSDVMHIKQLPIPPLSMWTALTTALTTADKKFWVTGVQSDNFLFLIICYIEAEK